MGVDGASFLRARVPIEEKVVPAFSTSVVPSAGAWLLGEDDRGPLGAAGGTALTTTRPLLEVFRALTRLPLTRATAAPCSGFALVERIAMAGDAVSILRSSA